MNIKNFNQKLLIILLAISLQSCIAIKNYPKTSLDNRFNIYEDLKKKYKNPIKIYLQNSEKYQIAQDYNNNISVSSYCHSIGNIYMGESNSFWRVTEKRAMKLNQDPNPAIKFVCSEKDADLIYEYSYRETHNPSALGNMLWAASLFLFPTQEDRKYEIELTIKDKNNKIIKNLGKTEFDHTIYISAIFIPVQIINKKDLSREGVIAEIIVDKIIKSLEDLSFTIRNNN